MTVKILSFLQSYVKNVKQKIVWIFTPLKRLIQQRCNHSVWVTGLLLYGKNHNHHCSGPNLKSHITDYSLIWVIWKMNQSSRYLKLRHRHHITKATGDFYDNKQLFPEDDIRSTIKITGLGRRWRQMRQSEDEKRRKSPIDTERCLKFILIHQPHILFLFPTRNTSFSPQQRGVQK